MCLVLNIMDNVNYIEDNFKYKFILKIMYIRVFIYVFIEKYLKKY